MLGLLPPDAMEEGPACHKPDADQGDTPGFRSRGPSLGESGGNSAQRQKNEESRTPHCFCHRRLQIEDFFAARKELTWLEREYS
jgi:hypothetical protein